MSDKNDCVLGATNKTKIEDHEKRLTAVEQAVIDIRDHLLNRPSWAVMAIITVLSSACVGLLVLAVKH